MKNLLLCSMLVAAPAFAGAPAKVETKAETKVDASKTAKDDEAIKLLFANVDKAFNSHDAKLMSATFLAEGTMVAPDGTQMKGRAEIEKHCADVFTAMKDMKHSMTVTSITYLRPDLAIAEADVVVTGMPAPPAGMPAPKMHGSATLVKDGGKWIAANMRGYMLAPSMADMHHAKPNN